ncbi:MAG: hypothetical protein ACAI38_08610 [Myxococcota bacterium]|nr:hypothetical protein [Myxococcota bacterium]
MRSAASVLVWVLVCASCQYEMRPVPGELDGPVQTGTPETPPAGPSSADMASETIRQCTSDGDCQGTYECALDDTCFRSCQNGVCDSGCTGVCRARGECQQKTPMPQPSTCEGRWHIAWDEHGCPRPPVCICPDGTPQPIAGGCGTTCTPPVCADGHALVAGADCYSGCAPACRGDDDCASGQRCLRRESCALVVCSPGDKTCLEGRECYGTCVAG